MRERAELEKEWSDPHTRFLFLRDVSDLSDDEFEIARRRIDDVRCSLEEEARLREAGLVEPTAERESNWSRERRQAFELDGLVTNSYTSFELVASGDREVIRRLRMYAQSFSGYQLATLGFALHRPWIRSRLPENHDEFLRMLVCRPDPVLADMAAMLAELPEWLRIPTPQKFGEIGWVVNEDFVANHDSCRYTALLGRAYEAGLLDLLRERLSEREVRPLRLLEIGGGYGGLAYLLMTAFPGRVRYAIVDLPESLLFSSIYLSVLLPDLDHGFVTAAERFALPESGGVTFIPNFLYERMSPPDDEPPFDLVLNHLSLPEMSEPQVRDYLASIRRWLGREGYFFEANCDGLTFDYRDLVNRAFDLHATCTDPVFGRAERARVYRNRST
jgi:hypothetical protein